MKRQSKKILILLAMFLIVIGMKSVMIARAQTTTMHVHFLTTDGKVSEDDPMDAVAAVRTENESLSGVSYDKSTDTVTINGLQADTLKVYASNIQLKGNSKVENFVVNSKIATVNADNGTTFDYGTITGKYAEAFSKQLDESITSSGSGVSKGNISLDKTSASIYAAGPGNTLTLRATTQGTGTVVWSSSDNNTATVNNGVVTPKKAGNITITATLVNDKEAEVAKATCTVTIKSPTITLSTGTATIYSKGINNYTTLTATVNGIQNSVVTWKTSSTAIATVNNGKITGVKAGNATITATANGVSATCNVTVKAPTLTLAAENNKKTIYTAANKSAEKSTNIIATINGTKVAGSDAALTWKSSKTSVATVTKGKVTTVEKGKTGTVTITATANGVSTTFEVTVKDPSISGVPKTAGIKKGKTTIIEPVVKPSSGTLTCSSSDKSVATVEVKEGKCTIKGVKAGEATITVKCNGVTATTKVTVSK